MRLPRQLTDHPASVGETYGEHFLVAARFARCLAVAAGAAAVHAVVPSLCTTTASDRLCGLHAEMAARNAERSADTAAA